MPDVEGLEILPFPVNEWLTTEQAVALATERGRKLDGSDLRKHCRQRFAREGLAALIDSDGVKTGPGFNYRHCKEGGDMTGRGVWLIHRIAVERRLAERDMGPGHRQMWRTRMAQG